MTETKTEERSDGEIEDEYFIDISILVTEAGHLRTLSFPIQHWLLSGKRNVKWQKKREEKEGGKSFKTQRRLITTERLITALLVTVKTHSN